jgi:hypothetical protein
VGIEYINGFEDQAAADAPDEGWTTSWLNVGTTYGRFGGKGAQINDNVLTVPTNASYCVGIAMRAATLDPGIIIAFEDSGGVRHLNINDVGDGTIEVRRSTTVLATSGVVIPSSLVHYYIELRGTINDTTGSYELAVDGTVVLSASSVDTRNAGVSSVSRIHLGDGKTFYGDDLYIMSGSGARKGDIRVPTLFPSGAGNSTAWTPSAGSNYQCVDEAAPNDDTDYVSSSTAGQRDTYAYDNLPAGVTAVHAVQVNLNARKDDAGVRTIATVIRRSGTDYDGTTQTIASAYASYRQVYEQDPSTSAAWGVAGVDAAEFGEKLVA